MQHAKRALCDLYRERLSQIYSGTLESLLADRLLPRCVRIDDNRLIINGPESKNVKAEINLKTNNVHIVSFGKSALSLTKAIGDMVIKSSSSASFKNGFVIAPNNLNDDDKMKYMDTDLFRKLDFKCCFGGKNNLPDEQSICATKNLFQFIETNVKYDKRDGLKSTFLVLFGGGGSACLAYPRYVTLAEKLDLIRFLQKSGADIVELNKVRRFFSHVKGGRLARFILDQSESVDVISLIVSDIIGNPLEFLASGPTYSNAMSNVDLYDEMISVLKKHNYHELEKLIELINVNRELNDMDDLPETMDLKRVRNVIICDNSLAIESAKQKAYDLGFDVHVLGNDLEGHTSDIIRKLRDYAKRLSACKDKPTIIIGGGETTIKSEIGDTWGVGGRCQEMGLDYLMSYIDADNSAEIFDSNRVELFFAATTDGQDGPTDVAACLVSPNDIIAHTKNSLGDDDYCSKLKFRIEEAKRGHNSNQFWMDTYSKSLLKSGLTGTNVMDLYILLIGKRVVE